MAKFWAFMGFLFLIVLILVLIILFHSGVGYSSYRAIQARYPENIIAMTIIILIILLAALFLPCDGFLFVLTLVLIILF